MEVQFQTDEYLYKRLFTELFIYLKHSELKNNWQCVIIYPNRKLEPKQVNNYSILLNSPQVTRVYLDELNIPINSLGISVLKLITESEETAASLARQLINITKQQKDNLSQKIWLELIETIIVYKYSKLSREEVEKMLGLSDLKQTRVYQEGLEEGKLKAVLPMLLLGATPEQIASTLELSLDIVKKIQSDSNPNSATST